MIAHSLRTALLGLSLAVAIAAPAVAQQGPPPQGPSLQAPAQLAAPPAGQQPPQQMPPINQGRPLDERPPVAPFQLTKEQAAYLDQVLKAWEENTTNVKTFRCKFTRWQYDPGFVSPKFKDKPGLESDGELTYSAPDKGSFKITQVRRLNPDTGEYEVAKDEIGEHWVCNGQSIWEYNGKLKQVIERPIPPEMQGKAISDGPLPFLFGAEADKLKRRYFLRIVTPEKNAATEVWVDGFPKFRADSANFQRAILWLKRSNFDPYAMRVYDPGNGYTSYEFKDVSVNDPLEKVREFFLPPRVPFGWRKVVELPPQQAAAPRGVAPPR